MGAEAEGFCAQAATPEKLKIRLARTIFPRIMHAPLNIVRRGTSASPKLARCTDCNGRTGTRQDNGPTRFTHCAPHGTSPVVPVRHDMVLLNSRAHTLD